MCYNTIWYRNHIRSDPARMEVLMLLEYVDEAMAKAVYDKVEDGTYCGKISKCPGVVALADTLYKCERALRSALEGWLIVKLRHGDELPVIGKLNLNLKTSDRRRTAAR